MNLKKLWWPVFATVLVLVAGWPAQAATNLDPALKWRTLETPHFSINYYPEIEDVAQRFAPIAEDVYRVMTTVLKYKLDLKTQVTLMDTTDFGNGFTTVFPYPAITLYLADLSDDLDPYKYDDYLRYVFLHEYTHALHLDIAEGGPSLFRAIFGRTLFPNAIAPWFLIEGMATYMESHYTNAGRGRDPRWEMQMRMDVLDDNIKTIDQAAVDTVSWPDGSLRYIYGVYFLQYLAEKYGEDKLISLAHVYGDYLFASGIDGAFANLYQENLSLLWSDWLESLKDKYQKQKNSLGKLTVPKLVTNSGYQNLQPKWSNDSSSVYYLQRNADDYPQIRKIDLLIGQREKIFEGQVEDENWQVAGADQLLFAKADIYKNFYLYRDLYCLDTKTRQLKQLTRGLRASDPALSADGKTILFVKNEKGNRSLYELSNSKISPVKRAATTREAHYFTPSYSPDGRRILAARRLANGEQRIMLIDRTTGVENSVTGYYRSSGEAVSEADPLFSADGNYIFFDADYNGIVNLYAYHLPSQRLFQVTNVIGGALMPNVSPDGKKLAYVSYSSKGYDIATMDVNTSSWQEMSPSAAVSATYRTSVSSIDSTREAGARNYESHDYNPLPSLQPRFWMPYNYVNENGLQNSIYLGSFDPLQQHLYYLNLGLDGKPSYTLYYVNNQFWPQINVSVADRSVPYGWNGNGTTYWEREKDNVLLFSLFDNRVFSEYDRLAVTVGLHNINLTNLTSLGALVPAPNLGTLNSVLLGWRYLNSRSYPYSISPEDGLDLTLQLERFTPQLKSDYNFTNYIGKLNNYFKLPLQHQVLASTLTGFYSRGDQLAQGNFSWRYINVRGYAGTTIRGNKGALASLEYRFPLLYPEFGLYYGTTFFDRLWGDLFFDEGGATFGRFDSSVLLRGVGGELNLSINSGWGFYGLVVTLGYASGLDQGGSNYYYFNLGL
jgi:Tol biopolymer transport system component